MKLLIKHMVCDRCIHAVLNILEELDFAHSARVELGKVELTKTMPLDTKAQFAKKLETKGFELLDNERSERVQHIKTLIINEIHHGANLKTEAQNYSVFIAKKLGYDYSYLNELFSGIEGKTIGQFICLQKIERAKELLMYDQLSLAVIADLLEYNSPQYLSAQFKKITGMTPSEFKSFGKRKSIDRV